LISVIIVNSGRYPIRLETTIKSILRSAEKNIEIIICTDKNVKPSNYFNEKVKIIEVKSNKFKNNIGFYRNIGAILSEGEYLYFTDEDVIIYNHDYLKFLKKLSKENGESVLIWPKMYRLDKGIDQFCKDFILGKEFNFFFDNNQCMYGYRNCNFYKIPVLKGIFDRIPHVCKPEDYEILNKSNFEELEELVWKPSIHWGGIFCRKRHFESVGGFSIDYFNWGCEDDDLIWKFSNMYNIIHLFEKFPKLSVLHLEHPRRYWNYYKNNLQIFEDRKRKGINYIISEDKKKYENVSQDIANFIGVIHDEKETSE